MPPASAPLPQRRQPSQRCTACGACLLFPAEQQTAHVSLQGPEGRPCFCWVSEGCSAHARRQTLRA